MLLAGDAAHVHYAGRRAGPQHRRAGRGEPGLEARPGGKGTSPESLLDTYHAERHPVAARALQQTMAQTALMRGDERIEALRDDDRRADAHRRAAQAARRACCSGLDIHYDLGEGHPLLGRRMPDLDLVTADGPLRVFELLHDARPVLLEPRRAGALDVAPWADRVQPSTPPTTARGSCRCSARSPRRPPC